jgi:hypothetical protein
MIKSKLQSDSSSSANNENIDRFQRIQCQIPLDSGVSDPTDPFNPEILRLNQDYLRQGMVKKSLTAVPVRRPDKLEFIRIHPDPAYRLDVALLELPGGRDETYFVHPSFYPELDQSLRSHYTLLLGTNRQKLPWIWKITLPKKEGQQPLWYTWAIYCAEFVMKKWARVAYNQHLGAYEPFEAEVQGEEPEWPELSFPEILRIGFRDRMVNSHSHPVMKQLRGAVP